MKKLGMLLALLCAGIFTLGCEPPKQPGKEKETKVEKKTETSKDTPPAPASETKK